MEASTGPPQGPHPRHTTEHHKTLHNQCTHRCLTRLYDQHDCLRCMVCARVPDFGYLYRCTQDSNGFLPLSDFVDGNMAMNLTDLRLRNQTQTCNIPLASMAASDKAIAAINSDTGMEINTEEDTMDLDTAVDETLARSFEGKRKFETAFPPHPTSQPVTCDLKICHACRPTFRDRAWQSLDHVVDHQVQAPPQYELNNRRVSDAATLSSIDTARTSELLRQATKEIEAVSPKVQCPSKVFVQKERKRRMSRGRRLSTTVSRMYQDPYGRGRMTEVMASDADDEKGFGNEDYDSDSTNTDTNVYSGVQSETDDMFAAFERDETEDLSSFSSTPSTALGLLNLQQGVYL